MTFPSYEIAMFFLTTQIQYDSLYLTDWRTLGRALEWITDPDFRAKVEHFALPPHLRSKIE